MKGQGANSRHLLAFIRRICHPDDPTFSWAGNFVQRCTASTSTQTSSVPGLVHVPLDFPTYTVWGANTGVGKTLASIALARAARRLEVALAYVKPVQTGFPVDSDARNVALAYGTREEAGAHAGQLLPGPSAQQQQESAGLPMPMPLQPSRVRVLYAWSRPMSPHRTMQLEGRPVTDGEVQRALVQELSGFSAQLQQWKSQHSSSPPALGLVETAGGVTSPAPSGTLQCDLLRPLRLPCILVGDPRLGGISATISAYESLLLRGYDVDLILFMEPPQGGDGRPQPSLGNADAVREHLSKAVHRLGGSTQVVSLPGCAPPPPNDTSASEGRLDPLVSEWLHRTGDEWQAVLRSLTEQHTARHTQLRDLASRAASTIWWPFTQHAALGEGAVQTIDSRCGEHWQVLGSGPGAPSAAGDRLDSLYDGASSWWTQAAPAELQPEVARSVAYAAGRYMHVMFPQNAHLPGVEAAARLLGTVGRGWASRVFFSDDGSTAVEVALKMAMRLFLKGKGLPEEAEGVQVPELQVLGLQNAYHGDTLGAMDCVAPSVFNSRRLQAPWYRGRGLFLHPPYLGLVRGSWKVVSPPAWLDPSSSGTAPLPSWESLGQVLSASRDGSELTEVYRHHIRSELDQHAASSGGAQLGAAIIEPLLQGAGGMMLVDPQFQRALVQVCRERGIPVIFDEVMTGLFRLGAMSAAHLLRTTPDIACYAKLMTAGVVPMAATLTTPQVFDAFQGSSKLQALLHGHSYTAYPVGCAATVTAMDMLTSPETNPNLCTPYTPASSSSGRQQGRAARQSPCCRAQDASGSSAAACTGPCGLLLPLWDQDLVLELSHHRLVSRVVALGTVLAAELDVVVQEQQPAPAGSSQAAAPQPKYNAGGALAVEIVRRLRNLHGVYARPLGSVVYLMVPPTTDVATCRRLQAALAQVLDDVASGQGGVAGDEEGVVV